MFRLSVSQRAASPKTLPSSKSVEMEHFIIPHTLTERERKRRDQLASLCHTSTPESLGSSHAFHNSRALFMKLTLAQFRKTSAMENNKSFAKSFLCFINATTYRLSWTEFFYGTQSLSFQMFHIKSFAENGANYGTSQKNWEIQNYSSKDHSETQLSFLQRVIAVELHFYVV